MDDQSTRICHEAVNLMLVIWQQAVIFTDRAEEHFAILVVVLRKLEPRKPKIRSLTTL
jgi:hypothetical protein